MKSSKKAELFFFKYNFILLIPGSNDAEQTEKSPSDEGFTELEPTVNGSAEETEGSASITLSIVNRDQQEQGPGRTGSVDAENKSILCHTKGKLDDEEDEGVAQNSSIEDGESIQSSSEAEKQGDEIISRAVTETKDLQRKETEEAPDGDLGTTAGPPVDQNRKLSLTEASEDKGNCSASRQSPDRPAGGAELSEEERRKKNYEAEMKSWLLERMQAPIEGRDHTRY